MFASSELFQHQLLNALMLQFHFDVASKNLSVLDGFDIELIGVLLTTSLAILLCNNELLPNEKKCFLRGLRKKNFQYNVTKFKAGALR